MRSKRRATRRAKEFAGQAEWVKEKLRLEFIRGLESGREMASQDGPMVTVDADGIIRIGPVPRRRSDRVGVHMVARRPAYDWAPRLYMTMAERVIFRPIIRAYRYNGAEVRWLDWEPDT